MKFALAGNPNSGKTTLFNALTGSTAHVGNWPGVTIDKKSGIYRKSAEKAEIIDLPGIYSLSPYSPEEIVSRNFLLGESPDCIINIVDATNLERNLYLTTQLMELDIPIVVALNMIDVVEKNKDTIDADGLSKILGVPVATISALKGTGIKELMDKGIEAVKRGRQAETVLKKSGAAVLISKIAALYGENKTKHPLFHAVKLIEDDEIEKENFPEIAIKAAALKAGTDTGIFEGDFEGYIADARYKYISAELPAAFKKAPKQGSLTKSDKIDKVLTHKVWGIPIFLVIMLAVFHITFSENFLFLGLFIPEGTFDHAIFGTDAINSPGVIIFNLMDWATVSLGEVIASLFPDPTWYASLINDGLLGGLFAVLSFVPQILVLFLFLSILEDSGYMARVAFIMDRAFRRFGLSGKAFMPLVMCFGCGVPGIMATRTLENEQERKRTIFLAPFFSCGAKLPIWAAFAGVFAHYRGLNAEFTVFSMYILGIAVAVISSFILKRTIIKGETPPFIMELPTYHLPQVKNTVIHLWEKLKHYVIRAGTIIAGAVVVIWFLTSFSFNIGAGLVEDSGDSILGVISNGLKWIFYPLGFGMGENGWKFVVATITGLLAKEVVVATMGIFAGMDGDEALETEGSELGDTPLGLMIISIGGVLGGLDIAVPAMFAFMAFNLLSVPCMAAVAAAKAEFKNNKWLWKAIAFWIITAYAVACVIFWLGVLYTLAWWVGLLATVGLAVLVVYGVRFAGALIDKKNGKTDKINIKELFLFKKIK
ncbi:MAG: ferrous iron transport protein B [Clostridiales bacterium]|jgi:ferrous iron transport protein B|nr:ferrous iron transport protein B [Clostridiales bacterium]